MIDPTKTTGDTSLALAALIRIKADARLPIGEGRADRHARREQMQQNIWRAESRLASDSTDTKT